MPYDEKEVLENLLLIARGGTIKKSNISRQSISEVSVDYAGHTLAVSWYPGVVGRGRIRSLSIDGLDTPLTSRHAEKVMHVIQDRAEEEFERRASVIRNIAASIRPIPEGMSLGPDRLA